MEQHGHRDGSRATINQLKEFGITVYHTQPTTLTCSCSGRWSGTARR
jgi:hypothetical protein